LPLGQIEEGSNEETGGSGEAQCEVFVEKFEGRYIPESLAAVCGMENTRWTGEMPSKDAEELSRVHDNWKRGSVASPPLGVEMQDKNVTHIMILSQDSIPLKPMRYMYKALEDDPVTRMCADDFVYKPWPRAETWWVMRRGDAELFKEHESQAREKFRAECSEEEAWYYPLRARMERWGYEAAPVKNECVMLTDWMDGPEHCKLWADMVKLCPNDCRVTRSMSHTESATKHPVIFNTITVPAFMELMASPFWFVRKIEEAGFSAPRRFAALLEDYSANYTNPADGYEENTSIPEFEDDLPDPEAPTLKPKKHWWQRLRIGHRQK